MFLKSFGNLFKWGCGTLVEVMEDKTMQKSCERNTFFKMLWMQYIEQNLAQRVIRHGFILYLALAMLAIPSAIANHQHRLPILEVAALGLAPNISAQTLIKNALDNLPGTEKLAAAESKPALPYHKDIMQAAETYSVDPTLIRAIIVAESSYNPQAVSKKGAQGLMQLMPTTARSLGLSDSFDPARNIDAGVRYFRSLMDRFDGDVKLALAAYNAGSRYVRLYGGVPPFSATQRYIKKVLQYQKKFQADINAEETNEPTV
jgi:soluble lytic murein transglycosylase-like protein